MATNSGVVPPPISWAQKRDLLYVIIDVECNDIKNSVTENSFTFNGTNALDANIKYEVTLNFLNSVDPERVTSKNIGRCIEYTIYKKESGPFWKSLTNDKTKLHFLKANFTKWKNESDDEDENESPNYLFNDMMSGQGMKNRFDDFNVDDDDDSDDFNADEYLPSLRRNDDDDEDDKKEEEKKDQEK